MSLPNNLFIKNIVLYDLKNIKIKYFKTINKTNLIQKIKICKELLIEKTILTENIPIGLK